MVFIVKNIQSCGETEKYLNGDYARVSDGIFFHKGEYVTTISFEQEPELGEGRNAAQISQYPLEDLLDRFSVYISDYYEEWNAAETAICRLEFAGESEEAVTGLRMIIGKHVYCRDQYSDGQAYSELMIE